MGGHGSPFVGRTPELAWLLGWAEELTTPAVLVQGEAGIGKSRVALEFASRLQAQRGIRVILGRCPGLGDDALPFAAFTEVLRELLATGTPPLASGVRRDEGRVLAHLLPELGPAGPRFPSRPSAGGTQLFTAVHDVLARAGADSRAVVIIEDAHWLTPPGLELLAFLVRSRLREVGFVVTARDDTDQDSTPFRHWATDLERAGLLDVLPLGALSDSAVDVVVDSVLGQDVPRTVTRRIRRLSGGNPYFAEELAHHEAKGGPGKLPRHLADLTSLSTLGLSGQVGSVLGAVAAAGKSVTHHLLIAVSGLDPVDLDEAVHQAIQARVLELTEDGRGYQFRHELVREASYDALLPADRRRLQLGYATRLAAQVQQGGVGDWPVLKRLAHHYDEAGEDETAIRWTLLAADAADSASAPAEALSLYQRALDLWASFPQLTGSVDQRRVDVYRSAARVADLIADHEAALSLVEEALHLVDPVADPTCAGLLEERRAWFRMLTFAVPAPSDCQRAVDLVPTHPPTPERARVLAAHSRLLSLFGRAAEAVPAAEEALSLALSLHAEPERVLGLSSLGLARTLSGNASGGLPLLEQAAACTTAAVDDKGPLQVLLLGALLLLEPDLTRVGAFALRAHDSVTSLGVDAGHALLCAAVANFELGRWAEAEEQALKAVATGGLHARLFAETLLGVLAASRGRNASVLDALQKGHPGVELPGLACKWYGEWLAEIHLLEGHPAAAVATVEATLDQLEGKPELAFSGRLLTFAMRARADQAVRGWDTADPALVADAQGGAVRLVVRAQRIHPNPFDPRDSPAPTAAADAATWEGERSRVAGAPSAAAWERAAAAWQALTRPHRAVYAQWRQVEALLAGRHHQSTVVPVARQAAATADLLGAVSLRRELDLLAKGAGMPRTASTAEDPVVSRAGPRAILTHREEEILRLVAEGLSNRAIAEALVISPKTVDTHLSHLLAKLDVHTRLAAANRARRLGLLN